MVTALREEAGELGTRLAEAQDGNARLAGTMQLLSPRRCNRKAWRA